MATNKAFPKTAEEITAVWLTEALRENGVIGMDTAVTSFTAQSLSGAGYVGHIVRITPVYSLPVPDAPATLIAKFPHPDPEFRTNMFWAYERESFFYRELAHEVCLNTPQCYFNGVNLENFSALLLLEDLSHLRMVDIAQGCKLEDVQTVVTQLAMHHAQWWQDPRLPEMEEFIKPVNERWDNQEEHWQMTWSRYRDNVTALLPNFFVPNSFLTMGDRACQQILRLFDRMAESPLTYLHNDTHVDNLLFATKKGDPVLTAIDWQLHAYAPGVNDISYFLLLSVPVSLRRQVERELLQTYHTTIFEQGVRNYSFAQCWEDYRLSFYRAFTIYYGIMDGIDLTETHGQGLIEAATHRFISFAEDHDVKAFLE